MDTQTLDISGSIMDYSDEVAVYDGEEGFGDYNDEIEPDEFAIPASVPDELDIIMDDGEELGAGDYMDESGLIYDKKSGKKKGLWKKMAPYLIPGYAPLKATQKVVKFAKSQLKGSKSKDLAKAIAKRNAKLSRSSAARPMLQAERGNPIDVVFGLGWLSRTIESFARNKRMIECLYGIERLCVSVGVLMHRYPDANSIRDKAIQVSLGSLQKSVVSATAVGGVATVATIATDQYWGGIVSVTDSQLNANYRPVTVVVTGTSIDTFTVIVWPKKFRWYIVYLMNRQAQGYASITRGLDATATIAADGVRTDAVLTHEGLNERDTGGSL